MSIANFEAKVKKTAYYGIVNPSSILRTSMKRLYAILMEIVGEIVAIVVGFGLLALICKVVGEHIGKKRDEKIEQNQPIEIQQKPKITIHYKDRPAVPPLELARNMLVSYYMDMGEDTTKSVGMESEFDRKRDIIELKIRHLIENEETNHGSFFLTADTDKDEKAKAIISSIGKSCFAITMFYVYGMENSFPDKLFKRRYLSE